MESEVNSDLIPLTYQFQLTGEHESLTRASAYFDRSCDVSFIYNEIDGYAPEHYFSSIHLTSLTSINEVWDRGAQLLALYNAAHELVETTQCNPRLHHSNLSLQYLFIGDSNNKQIAPYPRPLYDVPAFDDNIPLLKSYSLYGQLLSLAREYEDAYEVLLQFSQVTKMPDYYIAFETIRSSIGGSAFDKAIINQGLSEKYEQFGATTNNYDLGRQNSRHGIRKRKKSTDSRKKPVPITPTEAKDLAMNIGRYFFTEKYGFRFHRVELPAHSDEFDFNF